MIVLLIVASFLPNIPKTINGIICMSLFYRFSKVYSSKRFKSSLKALGEIDYLPFLLAGLCRHWQLDRSRRSYDISKLSKHYSPWYTSQRRI